MDKILNYINQLVEPMANGWVLTSIGEVYSLIPDVEMLRESSKNAFPKQFNT